MKKLLVLFLAIQITPPPCGLKHLKKNLCSLE